jgi:hypothetical protein
MKGAFKRGREGEGDLLSDGVSFESSDLLEDEGYLGLDEGLLGGSEGGLLDIEFVF